MLSVGSLFSGIGGFDLGLERTGGFYTAWFCEQDPFCRAVLEQHWPDRYIAPDITELRKADVARVDVLCGGFPCQDISIAGAGAGLAGARSGLWSEYARLIGELGPSYVVVENVSALLARGLGTVLADLAALGYDAEWDCIPASAVGAPHRRDRVWLVAYPSSDHGGPRRSRGSAPGGPGQPVAERAFQVADTGRERGEPGRGHGDVARATGAGEGEGPERQRDGDALDDRRADVADADDAGRGERRRAEPVRAQLPAAERCGKDVADAERIGRDGRSRVGRSGDRERETAERREGPGFAGGRDPARATQDGRLGEAWAVEPDVGRVAHGVPARVDRLRSLGNALVPQIAEWIGYRILDYEAQAEGLSDVA